MGIMAASVGNAGVLGAIGHILIVLDGQGIDIGSQGDGVAPFLTADQPHHPGAGDGVMLYAHLGELVHDEFLRFIFPVAELGMLVQVTADLDKPLISTIL